MNITSRWSVKCKTCGAKAGEPCVGLLTGKPRASTHIERWRRKPAAQRKAAAHAAVWDVAACPASGAPLRNPPETDPEGAE